jgi:CSLREA domain-containing protein
MRHFRQPERVAALLALLLLLDGLGPARRVYASTIEVTTFADNLANNGDCSLREAIQAANTDSAVDTCPAGSGADAIRLFAGAYTLSIAGANEDQNLTGDLDIVADLAIVGIDFSTTTIDAGGIDRAFDVHSGAAVTIDGLSITHGAASDGGGIYIHQASLALRGVWLADSAANADGGGIYNAGGALRIESSLVSDNTAGGVGGGVENLAGAAQIISSIINNNVAAGNGGGIHSAGQLLIDDAWIHDNSTSSSGAGIYASSKTHIINSLINDNYAALSGGNIYSGDTGGLSVLNVSRSMITHGFTAENGGGIFNDGALEIVNATINTNRAVFGDGIYSIEATQPVTLTNVTLAYNTNNPVNPGEGIVNTGAPIALKNTLIASNGADGDCAGLIASAGHNLEYGDTCGLTAAGDIIGADPLLAPISYDADIPVYPLLPGSPAINGGANEGCPAVDQRGGLRPHGASCDIGAYEANDAPHAIGDNYGTNEDAPLIIAAPGLLSNDTDSDNDVISATLVTAPAHGALTLAPNGAFSYIPHANYYGQDSFSYQVGDGSLISASAAVTLTVLSVNDPPIAATDSASTTMDTALTIPVALLLSNDTDLEGDALSISDVRGNSARGGRVMLDGGSVVYTPPAHFSGADSLIYTLSDSNGGTASGTVTITIGMRRLYLPLSRR